VIRLAILIALVVWPALPANPTLDPLLHSIESRYNRAQSLKLDFSETYVGSGPAPGHTESGVLYLRKPGRMRWDYTAPDAKLFLSDGKDVYLYTPAERRAEKSRLKESEDMRAPLAFLLGKLDFAKEFTSFETRPEGADTWISALPRNPNLAYKKVEFLAAADGEIRRVRVTGQDQSKLEFAFSNEQLNAPVAPGLFVFHPPAGVEVHEEDTR